MAQGDYSHDRSRCTSVTQVDGLFRFGTATGGEWPECAAAANREITLDLTRPVKDGGGTSRGVVVGTNYMKVYVVAMLGAEGKNAGLDQMSVGQTVGASWAAIEVTEKGTENPARFARIERSKDYRDFRRAFAAAREQQP